MSKKLRAEEAASRSLGAICVSSWTPGKCFLLLYLRFGIIVKNDGVLKSLTGLKLMSPFCTCVLSHTVSLPHVGSSYCEFKCLVSACVLLNCLLQVPLNIAGHCRSQTMVQCSTFPRVAA